MNEQARRACGLLLENRDRVKSVFRWENGLIHLACAAIFTSQGRLVDEGELEDCKELLRQRVSVFSNFRSTAKAPIAAMLAASGDPQGTLERGLLVYQLLKREFWGSDYLPLAAMMIAQLAEPARYEELSARTRTLYNRMKKEHPLLTSGEDSALSALLALSRKGDDELLGEMESCYQLLKPHFFSGNAVQSLSHVLTLCDGPVGEKCQRTVELYEGLKAAGYRYGTDHELPTLGVLAQSERELGELIEEIGELDGWLAQQKGFGLLGSVSRKQRLMYAGILTQQDSPAGETMRTAAISGTISLVLAQQAAMCAAIAASTAAAANASSNG